jgi:hypothetical protein
VAEKDKPEPSEERQEQLALDVHQEASPQGPDMVQALVEALLVKLRETSEPVSASELPPEPISPAQFKEALEALRHAGWTFDESARLRLLEDVPEGAEDRQVLDELRTRYPYLPREVAELLLSHLTGNKADQAIVGPAEYLRQKQEVVQRLVVTEELRERFYLRHCGKVPRYKAIDWEVVIKAVERGHKGAPNYPYALVTLDAVAEVHGHHEHKTLTFSIGLHGLRGLITELTELQQHLEEIRQSANEGSHADRAS